MQHQELFLACKIRYLATTCHEEEGEEVLDQTGAPGVPMDPTRGIGVSNVVEKSIDRYFHIRSCLHGYLSSSYATTPITDLAYQSWCSLFCGVSSRLLASGETDTRCCVGILVS